MAHSYLLGDSHSHLDEYPPEEIPDILQRARDAGVGFIICAGTTLDSTRACLHLASRYDMLYAGVGIHPMEAHRPIDDDTCRELEALAKDNPKVVCISEIGLDFLPTSPDQDIQYQVFREQIRLALSLNPNPPKDTDGRREGSGRGWVRELQGRWPGVLG